VIFDKFIFLFDTVKGVNVFRQNIALARDAMSKAESQQRRCSNDFTVPTPVFSFLLNARGRCYLLGTATQAVISGAR
jgi:hypothetical protein